MLEDFRVIDADTHFTEPADLWTSRAPEGYKDRVLHIEHVEGRYRPGSSTACELGFGRGGGVVDRDGNKIPFLDSIDWGLDWVHRGGVRPEARLQVMDECGIHAQVLFPNAIGLGGQHL